MDINHAACYRFYDEKGRRLAVFSRFLKPEIAEIFVLTCSKEDQFRKKFALEKYKEWLQDINNIGSATIVKVKIVPEEGTLKTLFRYAYNNLYYPVTKTRLVNKTIYKRLNDANK